MSQTGIHFTTISGDIPDAVEAMVKEELNDILKDQKVPESVSNCMEILVNAVQKNKKP